MQAPSGAMRGALTPPKDQAPGPGASAVSLSVLRKRAEFLKAASARRQGTAGFLLQARHRADGLGGVGMGFTASKKIGNAVLRNRAKRRLRSLAREVLAGLAQPGWDYVLVARPEATVSRPYADLCRDLAQALATIHRAP